ncbi:MAG: hypothetical protein ACI9C4_000969 [Paraglaciecola sp.]|jgi:hypothetical protein
MKPALLDTKPHYPRSWQALPLGAELKAVVETQLAGITQQFFGYHMVKVGNLSSELKLTQCSIKHCVNMMTKVSEHSSILSLPREMALLENSVDAFVLAHELDFAQDPHQILREVDRAIMPDGNLVIVGFNPFSITGLIKLLSFNQQSLLHEARFFSVPRLKDWLNLLGFEIMDVKYQPFSTFKYMQKKNAWSRWYDIFLPKLASVYIIVAKKRTVPMSLIKPKWQPKPKFAVVGVSMRTRGFDQNTQQKD